MKGEAKVEWNRSPLKRSVGLLLTTVSQLVKPCRKKQHPDQKTAKLKIERQEIIREVKTKSYQVVRLSRVKYIGNNYSFIDVRSFQRDMDDDRGDIYHPTTKGVQLREDLFRKLIGSDFIGTPDRQIDESDSYEM